MSISGQQNINIGLPNESIGSDSLYTSFTKTQENFDTLFACASPYVNYIGGTGISTSTDSANGNVTITNTGVTSITAGTNIVVNHSNGAVTISATGGGGGGTGTVTSVGLSPVSSSRLVVTNSPVVSSGVINIDLATSGATAGTYTNPSMTVDTYGRVTSIASGPASGTVTSVGLTAGPGVQVNGGPVTSSGNIVVTNTGVIKVLAGTGINLSGSNGNVTMSLSDAYQGTVTSVGLYSTSLVVTNSPITTNGTIRVELPDNLSTAGTFTAGNVVSNGTLNVTGTSNLSNVNASNGVFNGNVSAGNVFANAGTISASLLTGTITTAAQPNITSVGTLGALNVTGNVNSGNANLGNVATANYFSGSGQYLTAIQAGSISGVVAAASNATRVSTSLQTSGVYYLPFISATAGSNYSLNSNSAFSANISNGALIATTFVGALSGTAATATTAATVTTAAQPNITSVGTLSSLGSSGNITAPNIVSNTGAFYGSGAGLTNIPAGSITGQVANASTLNGASSSSSNTASTIALRDGSGNISATYFIGNGAFLTGVTASGSGSNISNGTSNVNIVSSGGNVNIAVSGSNIVSVASTGANINGNVTAGNVYANTGTIGASLLTGVLTTAAQPNITSVGTLSSLSVTGNISGANITGNHYGSGVNLTGTAPGLTAGNVSTITSSQVTTALGYTPYNASNPSGYVTSSGSVASATTAGTVTTSAQPNITSVSSSFGNLSLATNNSITLNGTSSNITGANLVSATYFQGNANLMTGVIAYANTATYAQAVIGSSQPNITSTGTLTSVNSSGNITGPNVVANTGAFYGAGTGLTGTASSLTVGAATVATSSSTAGTVTTSAQPNITSAVNLASVGTITSGTWNGSPIQPSYVATLNQNTTGSANNASYLGGIAAASYATQSYVTSQGYITSSGSITGSAGTFTSTTQNSQFNSIGVGTAGSGTAGEIRATNNITAYYSSDVKFKEDIEPIDNALDKVNTIGGKTFNWTDEYINERGGEDGYFIRKADFGVIAQDVQSAFPLAVRKREDGSLAVDYEKLCALAFQAIKELSAKVDQLTKNVG